MVMGRSDKKEFQVEYVMLSCPLVMLWNCISTPEGLSEWFADEVRQDGNLWTFSWNGSEQTAHLIFIRQPEAVRFRWDGDAHDLFFEFKILRDELTNAVSLSVTDFADADDVDDMKLLWGSQVDDLKRFLRV